MRVVSVCLGLVVVSGVACGGRGVDKVIGEVPVQGHAGAPGEGPAHGSGGDSNGAAGMGAAGATMTGQAGAAAAGSTGQGGATGIGGHPNGCCFSPRPTGGAPGGGGSAMAGSSGATGGAAGSGGATGGPTACSSFNIGSAMTLAPAAAGQAYIRCGTLGPEKNWTVTPSPTGDRLAAITGAGTVRLIATSTWTEIAQLASPIGEMDAVAFSPDGTLLATLSAEMGEVTLWRAQDGAFQSSFAGPASSTLDASASSLAFSSDGTRLATSLGIVINLTTGARTNWRTGAPDTTVLTTNPENLTGIDGGATVMMRFTAGNARLFVVTRYQIGNSPPTMRLELRDPGTGAQTVLFEMYERALVGYAISDDGHYIALAGNTEGAGSSGLYGAGLHVVDATTGTQVVGDATATSTTVLGFSHDAARLFTVTGAMAVTLGTTDLHVIVGVPWPTGAVFLGVSPQNDLVATVGGATEYIDPATGTVVRTLPFALAAVQWSADGRFGVGTGDPGVLFHFWIEPAGTQLCSPAAGTGTAPSIASLGTPVPTNTGTGSVSTTSADGSVTETDTFVIHGHSTDFFADRLTSTATGTLLRQFGAYASGLISAPFVSVSSPSADKAYTPAVEPFHEAGPDVAVWCR